MKTLLPLILTLTLGQSCRTVKDHHAEQQRRLIVENKKSDIRWDLYDSTSRYWYFHSDSPFYYHPEQGLYSRGGVLSVTQQQVRDHYLQQWKDSSVYLFDDQLKTNYSSKPVQSPYKWQWAIIGTVLVVVSLRLNGWSKRKAGRKP